ASSVGTPICTDQITNKPNFDREFGHFVRVLVDMDLKKPPLYRVLIERIGFAFFVDIDYENMPQYCSSCNFIGHDQSQCKRVLNDKMQAEKDLIPKKNQHQIVKKDYVISKDKRHGKSTESEVIIIKDASPEKSTHRDPMLKCILKSKENPTHVNANLHIHDSPVAAVNPHVDDDRVSSTDKTDTHTSKFVEATQVEEIDKTDLVIDDNQQISNEANKHNSPQSDQCSSHHTPTPVRVAKDMDFLRNSWANLAEQEDLDTAEQIQTEKFQDAEVAEVDRVQDAEIPFQVLASKKKGLGLELKALINEMHLLECEGHC
ncbi:defensin-like protein, partial [Trifolium medium]|nr:defensin-like protein [Trifolium medium]